MLKKLRSKLPRRLRRSKIWDKPSQQSQSSLSFDQQLVFKQTKKRRLPNLRQLKYISSFFSARERLVILASVAAIFLAGGLSLFFLYARFVEPVPDFGGSYREALVGNPVYINPLLGSTNDVDLDLVKLIFAGLLRYDNNGNLETDLAESFDISEDGKIYTVRLKDNIKWHDGEELTAEDVLFTYRLIQEPSVNSPLLLSLQDVLVEQTDEKTITFTLNEPFRPFASVLTLGIIPQHLWSNIPTANVRLAELNIKPVGAGPWRFDRLEKDRQGNIHTYTLKANEDYHGKQPFIEELSFRFYPDFGTAIEALNTQKVEGMSFVPRQLINTITNASNYKTRHLQLPQYTAIFINEEKNPALEEIAVRQALAYSIDRDRLIEDALDGLGAIADGPLLPGINGYDPEHEGYDYNPIKAQELLTEAGWEAIDAEQYVELETERLQKEREEAAEAAAKAAAEEAEAAEESEEDNDENEAEANETLIELSEEEITVDTGDQALFRKKDDSILSIKLTTVDHPENVRTAEIIRDAWQTIGLRVELDIVPVALFKESVLPASDYEALLTGHILNASPDLYTFWHSSQTEYPGLNLAHLVDKEADELLEKARQSLTDEEQAGYHRDFQDLLFEQLPAIFLYSPKYTYLLPAKIKGFETETIFIPADRWNNSNYWYIKTKRGIRK